MRGGVGDGAGRVYVPSLGVPSGYAWRLDGDASVDGELGVGESGLVIMDSLDDVYMYVRFLFLDN